MWWGKEKKKKKKKKKNQFYSMYMYANKKVKMTKTNNCPNTWYVKIQNLSIHEFWEIDIVAKWNNAGTGL